MVVTKRFNDERLFVSQPYSHPLVSKRHVSISARVKQGQASRKPKITMPTFKFSGDEK